MKIRKSAITVLVLAAMLTGCGEKKEDQALENSQNIIYEEAILSTNSFTGMVDQLVIHNNIIYIETSEILSSDEADEEETYSKGSRTIIPHLYSMNTDGSGFSEIPLSPEEGQELYLDGFDLNPDGTLLCIYSEDSDNNGEVHAVLEKMDCDGTVQKKEQITLSKGTGEMIIDGVKTDTDGNIYVLCGNAVHMFDAEFHYLDKIRSDSAELDKIAATKDGQLIFGESVLQGDKYIVQAQVFKENKWGDTYPLQLDYFGGGNSFMDGSGDYDFYYANESGIYGYQINEKQESKLFDRMTASQDVDLASIVPDGAGGFIGAMYEDEDDNSFQLVHYSKGDSAEAAECKKITYATIWVGDGIEQAIRDFNKEHKDYQIVLRDYSVEQNPLEKMNLDIAAGNIPDIIQIPDGLLQSYVAKGMLENLTPYLERDPDLSEEDFIPSVLEAMKIQDKLFYVSPTFEMNSLAGCESVVGKENGWNFDEFKTLLEEKGDDAQPFENSDKIHMLEVLLSACMADYIEWQTGDCSFDSAAFKDILEICNEYGTDSEAEENEENPYGRYRDGKVLLKEGYLDVNAFLASREIFGEDVNYIGYPTDDRQGSYFLFDGQIGIYSKSDNKDEAWEFLRSFLTKDFFAKYADIYEEQSVRQDCFDLMLEANMAKEPYTNSLGLDIVPREGSVNYGSIQIPLRPMTEEEAETYKRIIDSTNKSVVYDDAVMQIVLDEAKVYFAGDKNPEDTVEIIQNRVNTYVNENK